MRRDGVPIIALALWAMWALAACDPDPPSRQADQDMEKKDGVKQVDLSDGPGREQQAPPDGPGIKHKDLSDGPGLETAVLDGSTGEGGVTGSLVLLQGGVATLGPGSTSGSKLTLVGGGFEVGQTLCQSSNNLCLTGGITP